MTLYFVIFKNKNDKRYKMFSNEIFGMEKNASEFAKKSIRKGFDFKIVEYNKENYDRYWHG